MMPAYWIAHVTVTDPDRYKTYMALAPAVFAAHGGCILARGGESETFEGSAYQRQVVIEFPNLAAARACYASPGYTAAREARDGACIAHISIVEGV